MKNDFFCQEGDTEVKNFNKNWKKRGKKTKTHDINPYFVEKRRKKERIWRFRG